MNKYFLKFPIFFVLAFFAPGDFCQAQKTTHTFALVHGSWHGDWAWHKLETRLVRSGHRVININLPGHGLDTTPRAGIGLAQYADAVIRALDTVKGSVILVGHSAGGAVISEVAERKPGKVDKLVYLAAFLLQDGQSMWDISGLDTQSKLPPNLVLDPSRNVFDIKLDNIKEVFFGGADDETVTLAQKLLTPEPAGPITEAVRVTNGNFGQIDRYYITTLKDQAISPNIQELMYRALPCVSVYKLRSDHSPFFSKVTSLRNILIRIARDRRRFSGRMANKQPGQQIASAAVPMAEAATATPLKVSVYPNPANHALQIAVDEDTPFELVVRGPAGNLVTKRLYAKDQKLVTLDLSGYERGVYHVTVNAKGRKNHKKILVD